MFSGFEWSDLFLGHYLLSIFTCLIAVVTTFIISRKKDLRMSMNKNLSNNSQDDRKTKGDGTSPGSTACQPVSKKSPALDAERVIKENLTTEQQLKEHEVRKKQLAQIHELMLKQSEKFGEISLSDIEEQMKLYQ